MKSIRAWDSIVDPVNIWRGWREFARGKRRLSAVATFELDAPSRVNRIARELSAGTWTPGGYRTLRISDPKRRVVAAASIDDRVVHHALHRVIAPAWNHGFSAQSYACLPGRGSHAAILRCQRELRRFRWVLQLDIRRYFYSIVRERLASILVRRLPERPLQRLIGVILESGRSLHRSPGIVSWLGWDAPMPPGRGLPIGNLTSQWWGNVYLDALDHFVQRTLRVPSYLRYMDDLTLFDDRAEDLVEARDQIATWLERERGLELKVRDARPKRCDRAVTFLGYRVSRLAIRPGPKIVGRLPGLVRAKLGVRDEALHATLVSLRGAWMFGS